MAPKKQEKKGEDINDVLARLPKEYDEFMSQVNDFEKMLIDDGVYIIKFCFSITKSTRLRANSRISF